MKLVGLYDPRTLCIQPSGFIFAICAFATCGGYHGYLQVKVDCSARRPNNLSINIEFGYPFRLQQIHFKAPLCDASREEVIFLNGDFSAAAQFFVTVGVLAFLYSFFATIVYVFYQNKYLKNNRGPLVDFLVTVTFSLMWLLSSCCWAKSLTDIKAATNPTEVLLLIASCREKENRCATTQEPFWSRLNTSTVFGFLNAILWSGNIWFVFKETGWYKTERLYSESSFDQPDDGFGPFRQDSFTESRGNYDKQLERQASINQSQVNFSLPETYLGKAVIYERENKVASQGPAIFVNEM
uniref:MARVEL domain-containing protein n=1 Tax=Poecilia mexicana TaxID=48701 RepID=A0A3B3WLW0_9TELE